MEASLRISEALSKSVEARASTSFCPSGHSLQNEDRTAMSRLLGTIQTEGTKATSPHLKSTFLLEAVAKRRSKEPSGEE